MEAFPATSHSYCARWSEAGRISTSKQPLLLPGLDLTPHARVWVALPPASPVLTDNVRQHRMSVLGAAQSRWPRLSHLSAPAPLHQGDAEARYTQSSFSTRSSCPQQRSCRDADQPRFAAHGHTPPACPTGHVLCSMHSSRHHTIHFILSS